MQIQYVRGDATKPQGTKLQLIIHCCNDIGAWGKGFVVALSKRWPHVERAYRQWHKERTYLYQDGMFTTGAFELGAVQFVQAEAGIWVSNIIGQHGIRWENGVPPIRYPAILEALQEIRDSIEYKEFDKHEESYFNDSTVHMPRMGAGLAGGGFFPRRAAA